MKKPNCQFLHTNHQDCIFMNAQDLIEHGYFLSELPYCFSTKRFSQQTQCALGIARSFHQVKDYNGIPFSVPGKKKRRLLKIPHPIPYLLLSSDIANNWNDIEAHLLKSPWSFSRTTEESLKDRKSWGKEYGMFKEKCLIMSSTMLWELRVDIQSFYSSIYTHSIPWAIHDKKNIKSLLPKVDKNLLGNLLDKSVQRCQSGETKGIYTGSENFRIVAEIVSAAIDNVFDLRMNELGISMRGARYVDDSHFFFLKKEDAETAKRELELIVQEYHLELHPEKTRIIERPCAFEDKWIILIDSFRFSDDLSNQKEELKLYANLLIVLAIENPNASVIKKGLGKFFKFKPIEENTTLFESLLYRIVLCSTNAVKQFAYMVENFNEEGYHFEESSFKEFLMALLFRGITNQYNFETNWALYLLNRHKMSLDSVVAQQIVDGNDSLAIIQVLDMKDKNLLEGDLLQLDTLANKLNSYTFNGSMWMLAYEAEMRGWLTLRNIDQHSFFKKLKSCRVSFYESPRNARHAALVKDNPPAPAEYS